MKSILVLPLCALLAGCGSAVDPSAPSDNAAARNPLPKLQVTTGGDTHPDGPTSPLSYGIDAGVGSFLDPNTFSITTNNTGTSWFVAWTGDAFAHDFYGEITALSGSTVTFVPGGSALDYGDWAAQMRPDFIQFEATTDGSTIPYIQFDGTGGFNIPVRFNLYIDGYPAIWEIIFPSFGILGTTDVMPVDIQPRVAMARGETSAAAVKLAVQPAPAFRNNSGTTPTLRVKAPGDTAGKPVDR